MSVTLPVRRFGAGPAPALALHCMLGSSRAWAGIGTALEDVLEIRAPDLPGHGEGPDWPLGGNYFEASLEAVRPLLDAPCHLIGHSFGAVLALRLACDRPDLVRTLTLIEPVFFAILRGSVHWRSQRTEVERLNAWLAAGEAETVARRFTDRWGAGVPWEALAAHRRAAMVARIGILPDQWAGIHEDCTGLLAPGILEAMDRPVLLVSGGASPAPISPIADSLAARLPRPIRLEIGGAGHMLPVTHAAALAPALRPHVSTG